MVHGKISALFTCMTVVRQVTLALRLEKEEERIIGGTKQVETVKIR
jgi:hypothetical protein